MTRLSSHHFNPSGLLISRLYTESRNKSKNLSKLPFSLDCTSAAVFQLAAPLHNLHAIFVIHVCVYGLRGAPFDTSLLALLAFINGTGEGPLAAN